MLDRRQFVLSTAALATLGGTRSLNARALNFSDTDYADAVVIDGQSNIGDPYGRPSLIESRC